MDRVLFVLFIVGVGMLSFLYGAATYPLELFPYQILREAELAWDAWGEVETNEFPKAFKAFEPAATASPRARRLQRSSGQEYVLVTGGPYQLLEQCPTYGCMAWITDRAGNIVHSWEVNLDELWEGITGVAGDVNPLSLYPVGMGLTGDGSLVVTFQGRNTFPVDIGIVKFDREGKILWKRFDHSHHWHTIGPGGRIYAPYGIAAEGLRYIGDTRVDLACRSETPVVQAIRVLGPQGEPLREIDVLGAFLRADLPGLFYGLRDGCDPVHLNSVALATKRVAAAIPGAEAGDLLISLRESSAVALLDGETGDVKHLVAGRTAGQHGPQFLLDGTILAFDNLGGKRQYGGTRIVRLDLVEGTSETVFPRGDENDLLPVYSRFAGQLSVSANGRRALVAVTHQGRIIEIDVTTGAPLWVYDNTHDIGPFLNANDIDSDTTRARFATYGAYYVDDPSFLDEHHTALPAGDEE